MIRKTQLYFKFAKGGTDALSVLLALMFLSSVSPRVETIVFAMVCVVIGMAVSGGYRLGRALPFTSSLVRAFFMLSLNILASWYLFELTPLTLEQIVRVVGLGFVYMITARVIIEQYETRYYKRGFGRIPIFVIGMSRAGEAFLKKYANADSMARLHILGFLDNNRKESVHGVPYLGKLIDLESRIEAYKPEAVIQVGVVEQAVTMTAICQKYNLEYHVLPSLIGAFGSRVSVNDEAGFPLISVKETNLKGWGFAFKRIFDVVVSALLLILLSPLLLIISLFVAIERRSLHVIVRESRMDGRTGAAFGLYRFRTLKNGAEEKCLDREEMKLHSHGVIRDKSYEDATPLGKLLRRTELNELPQLLNVLNNTMSIVGPRPPFQEELQYYTNFHHKRLRLKPGITGMWQVYREKSEGKLDDLLRMDIFYVENWSLGLDVKILARTGVFVIKKLFT